MDIERESMEFDVVIVGAGPAGLSTACRIQQQAQEQGLELMVAVVEKGSEVGAHILSGAVFEPRALDELFPDWESRGAPLNTPVKRDDIFLFHNEEKSTRIPNAFVHKTMHNEGNYIISLGNLCRWLKEQAEELGVEILEGFPASSLIIEEDGSVAGVITGDMGISAEGEAKDSFTPGYELRAKYTVFAEGCRGHLGKELISNFHLDAGKDPQHYGIGIKELWDINPDIHEEGLVIHATGWPLKESNSSGGWFLYCIENNQAVVGLITDLNYSNPHVSPFDEFQRGKHHPELAKYLEGGRRVSYGARAIAKGGLQSLPKMTFPGGLLVGCDAGTLNAAKIKGSHAAMKSGIIAGDAIVEALAKGEDAPKELTSFTDAFENSWLYEELHQQRNFTNAIHKFGIYLGGAISWIDINLFKGKLPFTMHDRTPDHACLTPADEAQAVSYPKPDGKISFDKLSSVFLSSTNHEEDQPCHLKLRDPDVPVRDNLPTYDEPAQRFCPAGVYEILANDDGGKRFQINSQNCVHCKTCDIKDPSQNITWVTPEGFGGPNYPNM